MFNRPRFWFPLLLFATTTSVAQAQLFGTRNLGQPLSRRPSASAENGAGQIAGNERFLRENRRRSDFVGSDQRDQQGFVGSQQARGTGPVISSTAGLREKLDRSSQTNRPLAALAKGTMYPPRIRLDQVIPVTDGKQAASRLAEQLAKSTRFSSACRFSVSVAGRQAIVQGEVSSARERHLVELVLLFEPGIESVSNQLKVQD